MNNRLPIDSSGDGGADEDVDASSAVKSGDAWMLFVVMLDMDINTINNEQK